MQPLGSAELMAAYHERIASSHDYDVLVDVLTMNERPVSPATLVDGQVNIQRETGVRRTGTLTLLDPDSGLNLDTTSPSKGALFANRLVRIRHIVDVPGFGPVSATAGIGPISKLNRNGATIDIEWQDKTALAILGCPPMTVTKGENAVSAIVRIMRERTGEFRFRVPTGTRKRLPRNYSVGWPDESSPWAVCGRIARAVGLQMFYSCDGYFTLRPRPTQEVFEFGDTVLTSAVSGDNDFSGFVNYARATAGDKIVRVAEAPADHPMAPGNAEFKRNGVKRYLPSLADVSGPGDRPDRPGTKRRPASKAQLHKFAIEMEKYANSVNTARGLAQATADSLLAAGLPMNANLAASSVPVFHLDVDDPIRLTTATDSTVLPFAEASIPLVSGEMTVGLYRRVSRPGRRVR